MDAVINLRHEPALREKFDLHPRAQQHRARRPPHQMGEPLPGRDPD